MKATKIDWCDCTINPVVGCPRGCEYCYACKMNARFKWVEDFSKPKFFPKRLEQLSSKKPKSIFINSMSDIAYWKSEQLRQVIWEMATSRQHKYIALTKDFIGYLSVLVKALWGGIKGLQSEQILNVLKGLFFVGETITKQSDVKENCINGLPVSTDFINIEPILEPIDLSNKLCGDTAYRAIIIGAETGKRKGKIIPKKEWVDSIVKQADEHKISVFMKGSLREIMGADFRQDPLMWEGKHHE